MRSALVAMTLTICMLITLTLPPCPVGLDTAATVPAQSTAGEGVPPTTYRLGTWQGLNYVGYLCDEVGVPRNREGYRFVVENHLLPLAIRGGDLGGYSIDMPDRYLRGIDEWLSVCDEYGLSNWFAYGGWGYAWWSGWQGLTGQDYPEAMSHNSLGEEQPTYVCVIDDFDTVFPWHRDKLKRAIDWYADHPSIGGFGVNPLTDAAFYMGYGETPRTPGELGDYGFNPTSFSRFTKTPYFLRDVDETGHHSDGTPCKLWEQFVEESATYPLVDLIEDVRTSHYAHVREYPLHGYVAYMNVANAKLVKALYDWLASYRPDRTWIVKHPFALWVAIETGLWDSPAQALTAVDNYEEVIFRRYGYRMMSRGQSYSPSAKYILGWSNICNPGDNPYYIPSNEEKYNLYLIGVPTLPMNPTVLEVDWRFDYIADPSVTAIYRNFGSKMNLMRAYGGWFGKEASLVKGLAIGESEIGWAPQMLTSTIDLAMTANDGEDLGLARFGDFTEFDVLIIWGGGRPHRDLLSPDCQTRILNFVSNGGGLVVFGRLPSWLSLGGETPVTLGHPITQPFTDLTLGPALYEWTYGVGRVTQILNPPGIAGLEYASRSSDFWAIATNAVLYSAGREDLVPAWFYEAGPYAENRWTDIYHSICGVPGGVLVWLSNRGAGRKNVQIRLNPRFYGINPDGWLLVNPIDLTVSTGKGEISVQASVPGLSWSPIYVVNKPLDLYPAYCNLMIRSMSVIGEEARLTVDGPPSQNVRLIVAAGSKPNFVGTDTLGGLNEKQSREELVAAGNGWFYDTNSRLLLIDYRKPSISDEVRIGRAVGVNLVAGYNFISLPVVNDSFTASTLLAHIGDTALSIFTWDETTQQYVSYDKYLAEFGVSQPDFPILPDVGYVVYSSEDVSFDVSGGYTTDRAIHLRKGYNLAGWTSLLQLKATTAFVDPSDGAVESVFLFDVNKQEYVCYDVDLAEFGIQQPNFDVLEGRAYFVFANTDKTIRHDG